MDEQSKLIQDQILNRNPNNEKNYSSRMIDNND